MLIDAKPKFPMSKWSSAEVYEKHGITGYEPMTAKELDTEEEQDKALNSLGNYLEEKFDGTRALLYLFNEHNRVFSRRISKKTGFYVENTDLVPQIRDSINPDLSDTILDGEMFIPGAGFQVSCAIMNCRCEKAIERQMEEGFQVFHAFDILFYKGKDLRDKPLRVRKMYLHIAVRQLNSRYVKEVACHNSGDLIYTRSYHETHGTPQELFNTLDENTPYQNFYRYMRDGGEYAVMLPPRVFYEYIVATGGEGLIVKPKEGKYLHKRGWEYSKIKAFLTRELILIRFDSPEPEYKGKFPNPEKWDYWEDCEHDLFDLTHFTKEERDKWIRDIWNDSEFAPVSKYYAKGLVGNMILGVLVSDSELSKIPKSKQGKLYSASFCKIHNKDELYVMEVCECSGYTDEVREHFTKYQKDLIGSVVEVKANGIMKDTGRMRHPRFLRCRPDKNPEQCIWADHIGY